MSQSIVPNIASRLTLKASGENFPDPLCQLLEATEFFSDLSTDEIEVVAKKTNIYGR